MPYTGKEKQTVINALNQLEGLISALEHSHKVSLIEQINQQIEVENYSRKGANRKFNLNLPLIGEFETMRKCLETLSLYLDNSEVL